jgi:hypothetical protein
MVHKQDLRKQLTIIFTGIIGLFKCESKLVEHIRQLLVYMPQLRPKEEMLFTKISRRYDKVKLF